MFALLLIIIKFAQLQHRVCGSCGQSDGCSSSSGFYTAGIYSCGSPNLVRLGCEVLKSKRQTAAVLFRICLDRSAEP